MLIRFWIWSNKPEAATIDEIKAIEGVLRVRKVK